MALEDGIAQNLVVAQARGNFADVLSRKRTESTFRLGAEKLRAELFSFDQPAISCDFLARTESQNNQRTKEALVCAAKSKFLVYSVGSCTDTSGLFRSGLISDIERQDLAENSVGDICSHYIDARGRVCLPDLNSRCVGLTLPEIRKIEQKLLVAGGTDKVLAIHAALKWGYANRLVTDIDTAQKLLSTR